MQKLPIASATESKASGPPGIHSCIPPQADRIPLAMNAGKLEVHVTRPGRQLEFVFRDYQKPGDVLRIDMDVAANRLLGMHVSSYLDERDETIEFDVAMSALADGTTYAAKTTLAAKAKDIVVTIENTGYRRAAG